MVLLVTPANQCQKMDVVYFYLFALKVCKKTRTDTPYDFQIKQLIVH